MGGYVTPFDFELAADSSFDVDFDLFVDFGDTAASAAPNGTRATEPITLQEQADNLSALPKADDAEVLASLTLGGTSGAKGDQKWDTPMSARVGLCSGNIPGFLVSADEPLPAGSSAGNHLAGNSNSTPPAPTASNKRRRDAQYGAEDQRPAQCRATTSVAAPTVDASVAAVALEPTQIFS